MSRNGNITTAEALEMKRAMEAALAKRGVSSSRFSKKKKRMRYNALIVAARPGLLGVLDLLPGALRMNHAGYRVFIRCAESLHDFFECFDYCEPDLGGHTFDKIIDPTRAFLTATTTEQKAWRVYLYTKFAKDFGLFTKVTFSRLPNPRVSGGEYHFAYDAKAETNVGFRLRFLPWYMANAKTIKFIEPKGSDVASLILTATRGMHYK